jgi:hypothetical protein
VAQVIEALRKQVRVSPQSTTFQVCAAASVLAELEACAAGNELWPGAGPLTLSYEVLDAKDPQDRFEVRRAS